MTVYRDPAQAQPVRKPSNRAWIDFAKGSAIILVVLYHASLFLSEIDLAGSTPRLRAFLSFIPMAVFFFIAGLTAGRSLRWRFADLWRRRISGLVYLYLLWSGLRVLFYLLVPHLRASERSPTDPLTIALLPIWPTSSLWFIWALALFAVIAWLARRFPVWLQLALSGILAVASSTPGLLDTNNVGWDRVFQNLFFFLIALYAAPRVHSLVARIRGWHFCALFVAYASLAVVLIPFHGARIPGLVLIEGAIAIALTISASTLLVRVRWLTFVSALGRASLTVYLIHLFIIAAVVALVLPLADSAFLQRSANALPFVLAAGALAAALALGRILRRVTWLWVNPFRSRRIRSATSRTPATSSPIARPRDDAFDPVTAPTPPPRQSSRNTKE